MSITVSRQYDPAKCVRCGQDLPKGRKTFCYACRPAKVKKKDPAWLPDPDRKLPYNIEECCALARAYGISYGRVVQIVENHLPWPPRVRPLVWPSGSVYAQK